MTLTIRHAFVSGLPDNPEALAAGEVCTQSHWNATHAVGNIAANTILGNNSNSSASPDALTGSQVTALLNTFSAVTNGVVPASGGGTNNFMRADGIWAPINTFTPTAKGLVPASGGGTLNFMRADGLWAQPPVGGGGGGDPLLLTQGLSLNTTDPTLTGDPTNLIGANFVVTYDTNAVIVPGFSNAGGVSVNVQDISGLDIYYSSGPVTNAKNTHYALFLNMDCYGSGQNILYAAKLNGYAASDTFAGSETVQYASGPIGGDEGIGYRSVSSLNQLTFLTLGTIQTVTRSGINTTATQIITSSLNPQTVTVVSSAGASPGDWVCVDQETAVGSAGASPNMEAVKLTGVGAGTITGIFRANHNNGVTIKPAMVLNFGGNLGSAGEGRYFVNTTGASYSTGTVSNIVGGGFTGSGTGWATNMVGGNATNIGAISLDADTYTSGYFSGAPGNSNGPLHSWYRIQSVSGATALGIISNSVAGDASYHGYGPGAGGYIVRPSAMILRITSSADYVCEASTAAWNVGHVAECAITPYPDVTGFQYSMSTFTAGGIRRAFMLARNSGARTIDIGFWLDYIQSGGGGSNTDDVGWGIGFSVPGCQTGLYIGDARTAAISMMNSTNDNGGKIEWIGMAGAYLSPVRANGGFDWIMTDGATNGHRLRTVDPTHNNDGVQSQMVWQGYLQLAPIAANPYLRFGGINTPGGSLQDTIDIAYNNAPYLSIKFNDPANVKVWEAIRLVKTGILTFGDITGSKDAIIDPTGLTATRTITVPNVDGGWGVVDAAVTTPASSAAAGSAGTIVRDANFLYVCVATNTWVRAALTGGW
jgi:hypothetical protein